MSNILEQLEQLNNSNQYPFHMPGHKRQPYIQGFAGAYGIDITEIEGYDNLYEPEGMIKDALEYAKRVYGSDETLFLVNGSTVGILSAVTGVVKHGQKVLVSRNCHKAVFHALELCQCETVYLHPGVDEDWDIMTHVLVEEVEESLKKFPEIKAIIITSPTYEGIVSDVRSIAKLAHEKNIPLLVDEAHGAHFPFDKRFPESALSQGADVVIQSMHKTLPSFTQTALLHMKRGLIDSERIKEYLGYFQTSSPSYLFMAGMDACIRDVSKKRESLWDNMFSYRERLLILAAGFRFIRVKTDTDPCKLLISVKNTNITGRDLQKKLLEQFHIQVEMACDSYVLAIITCCDTEEGIVRLGEALLQIDKELYYEKSIKYTKELSTETICYSLYEVKQMKTERIDMKNAMGRVAAKFVNLYPPGIPIVVPGEMLTRQIVDCILDYKEKDLNLQGLHEDATIEVCVIDGPK